MCLALTRVEAPSGPWLDLCTGPGGKSALLTGLTRQREEHLIASEITTRRAKLVEQALAVYPPGAASVICSDGRDPEPIRRYTPFARVMMDAPYSGLGALRRRPEARWHHTPAGLAELVSLQRAPLETAIGLLIPGGVAAYVTCSPHADETAAVVEVALKNNPHMELLGTAALLPEVPGAARGGYMQL